MKTRLLSILTSLLYTAYVYAWDGSVATDYAGGQGTADDPYQIANAEQLAYLAHQVNEEHITYRGKYFVLTDDIDLFGKNGEDTIQWTPIGIIATDVRFNGEDMHPDHHPFRGTLDGKSHTIRNLYIHDGTLSGAAIFRHINLASIRNMYIENVRVFAQSKAAALCAQASYASVIENCHVLSGNITVTENYAGGIVAYIKNYCYEAWSYYDYAQHYTNYYSVVKNCSNNANILSLQHASEGLFIGGIAGWMGSRGATENETMHIIGCKNFGTISSRLGFGGICGYIADDRKETPVLIDSCANYGSLYRKGAIKWGNDEGYSGVGGILGATLSKGYIQHCLNAGDIYTDSIYKEYQSGRMSPPSIHGGIVGYLPCGKVSNCVNIGFSDGKMPYGGICGVAGHSCSSNIENCLNAGSSNNRCGGIVYKLGEYAYARNCVTVFYDYTTSSPGLYSIDPIVCSIASSSVPPPSNSAATHILNSYFDVQTNSYDNETYGPLTKDYGQRFTHQMIGDGLRDKLEDTNWVYTDGMYPRPKGTEDVDIAVLAATPIFLNYVSDEEYDNLHNIHASFTLGEVEGVTWSTNSPLLIEGNKVYVIGEIPADSVYTLYAHYGKATRKYEFGAKTLAEITLGENIPDIKSLHDKILRNGQILILRGDKVYTITGQEVR